MINNNPNQLSTNTGQFLSYTKWAFVWALLILILCIIPGKDLPPVLWLDFIPIDKLVHVLLFMVQAMLLIWGFSKQTQFELIKVNAVLSSILICIVYGAALEWVQGNFCTDRTADIYDILANTMGTIFGAFGIKQKM